MPTARAGGSAQRLPWKATTGPPRLPRLVPDDLDDAQRRLYERITSSPRGQESALYRLVEEDGALTGPFGALLLTPEVGTAVIELGRVIRYCGALPPRVRELAILLVASARRSDYEWRVHAAVGRAAGLTDEELSALAVGKAGFTDRAEQAAHDLTLRAVRREPIGDDLWERASHALGHAGVVELLVLVGYYDTLALLLAGGRIGAPLEP